MHHRQLRGARQAPLASLHRRAPLGLCSRYVDVEQKPVKRTKTDACSLPVVLSLSLSLFSRIELISACWNTEMTYKNIPECNIPPKNQPNFPPWCYLTRKPENLKERRYFKIQMNRSDNHYYSIISKALEVPESMFLKHFSEISLSITQIFFKMITTLRS